MEGDQCRSEQCVGPESVEAGLQGGVLVEGGLWIGGQGTEQDDGFDKVEQREEYV